MLFSANAIKVSANFLRSFNASSDSSAPVGNIAAVNKRTAPTYKALNRNFGFCGRNGRPCTKCLERRSKCLKGGKRNIGQQRVSHMLQLTFRKTAIN